MKKLLTTVALAAFTLSSAFAVGMSAGVGASASTTLWTMSMSYGGTTATGSDVIVPVGAKAFFDTKYLQLSVGYIAASQATLSVTGTATATYPNDLSYMTFAALGKLPFKLLSMTVFPLVGIEYDLNVSHPSSGGYFEGSNALLANPTNSDYNELWIKGGVGVDVDLGQHFYLRPEALFGIKPLNSDEQAVVNSLASAGLSNVTLGFGTLDLSLLLGYKL